MGTFLVGEGGGRVLLPAAGLLDGLLGSAGAIGQVEADEPAVVPVACIAAAMGITGPRRGLR
jgi:hypothetical protein